MLSVLWWTSYHSHLGGKCLIRKFETWVDSSRLKADSKADPDVDSNSEPNAEPNAEQDSVSGFAEATANAVRLTEIESDDSTGLTKTADHELDKAGSQSKVTMLVVSPNLSMSWRANLLLVAAIAVVCFGSALVWAYFGFWMVLPFAGLEVLFVTICLYLTVRKLSIKEVITIGSEEIRLEWGMYEPQRSVTLPRHWSRLDYQCDDNPFEVGSLTVGAHGKHYPLGLGLGKDEKRTLYLELHQLL